MKQMEAAMEKNCFLKCCYKIIVIIITLIITLINVEKSSFISRATGWKPVTLLKKEIPTDTFEKTRFRL